MTQHTIAPPTDARRVEVSNTAIETCYEDAMQNSDYLRSIVEQWVRSFGYEDQLDIITNDRDMWAELLSFDPGVTP